MSSGKQTICVFGATGNQGGSVVTTFLIDPKLKDGWAVRAVTRDTTKDAAKKLQSQGAEVVAADLDDKASLVKAVTGADVVFAVTNYWEKLDKQVEIQQGKNLVDAAKEAGVGHFIWSSLLHIGELTNGKLPNVFHFDSKAEVESYARNAGITASFFLPGFFMNNLPGSMMRPIPPENNWTLALPIPETAPVPLFCPADTGKWIKAMVLKPDRVRNQQILAATNYLTLREIVDIFKTVYPEAGKTAQYVQVSHDDCLKSFQSIGLPDYGALELLENLRLLDEYGYYGGASLDKSHEILEDELTTWEQFLKTSPAVADLK